MAIGKPENEESLTGGRTTGRGTIFAGAENATREESLTEDKTDRDVKGKRATETEIRREQLWAFRWHSECSREMSGPRRVALYPNMGLDG